MSNTVDMIFEAVLNGELDDSQRDRLENIIFYEYPTKEKIMFNQITAMMDYLKKVHDEVPNEYSDNKYIKKFIDKHYEEMMKILKYFYNKDDYYPITENRVKLLITCCLTLLGGMLAMLSSNIIILTAGFISFIISFVTLCVAIYPAFMKIEMDNKMYKDIINIREYLKKIFKTKKLPNNYNEKISVLISKIDDIERNHETDSDERKVRSQEALVTAVAMSNR